MIIKNVDNSFLSAIHESGLHLQPTVQKCKIEERQHHRRYHRCEYCIYMHARGATYEYAFSPFDFHLGGCLSYAITHIYHASAVVCFHNVFWTILSYCILQHCFITYFIDRVAREFREGRLEHQHGAILWEDKRWNLVQFFFLVS